MATEKGKASSSGDKKTSKTSPTPNIFSIFTVGVVVGLMAGFILGWWYPAPDRVRDDIDSTKTVTREKVQDMAQQARKKTADMLEQRANQLRHPLGHTVDTSDTPVEPPQHQETSVPIP